MIDLNCGPYATVHLIRDGLLSVRPIPLPTDIVVDTLSRYSQSVQISRTLLSHTRECPQSVSTPVRLYWWGGVFLSCHELDSSTIDPSTLPSLSSSRVSFVGCSTVLDSLCTVQKRPDQTKREHGKGLTVHVQYSVPKFLHFILVSCLTIAKRKTSFHRSTVVCL